jgi:hypothetical protein
VNELLIGVTTGVIAGIVAPTIYQSGILGLQWLRRPQLWFSTDFTLEGLRRAEPSFAVIVTNTGRISAHNVTIRLEFPFELVVATTSRDPLNAPQVKRDGKLYSRF